MGITQADRLLSVTTPLGADVVLIDSFNGSDGISEPFEYDLTLLAEIAEGNDSKVTADKLMGQSVTVTVALANGKKRHINGIVSRFSAGAVSQLFASYSIRLVPTLSLLDLKSDSRIFQRKSVPDVITKVFNDLGLSDFKLRLSREYTPWDYCVQYRETDFNFVSRLMEEEGIWYHFEHSDGKHMLILSDQPSAYTALPDQDTAYIDSSEEVEDQDTISSWELRNELFPGKYSIRDHHVELTGKTLEAQLSAKQPFDVTKKLELYDFPGSHAQRFNKTGDRLQKVQTEADAIVKLRMEETEASRTLVEGDSHCRTFTSGFKFKVDSRTLQKAKGSYVLTSVQHTAQQMPGYSGDGDDGAGGYQNRFTCIPADVPMRPERQTPKPVIHGLQSAEVITETEGEEIWPDKYGRVRVRFAWDREVNSGCWVQVAQQRAGKSGGQIWIPRVGDEVMVAYMEGDPDCPIIVGSVYNANNMPPYALPDNKTQSGIKTRSSTKGGSADYNELRFEDKKGSEEILLHAQKQLTTEVEADEFRTVGANRTTTIKKDDKRVNEEGDEVTILEKGSKGIGVKKDFQLSVEEGNGLISFDKGDLELMVEKGMWETQIGEGDVSLWLGQGALSAAVDTGNADLTVAKGNVSTTVKMGNYTLKVDMGKVTIEALQGITIKSGNNSIVIDATGVSIKGLMVNVEGETQTNIKGLMTSIDGTAMLKAKGAITMLG